MYFIKKLFHYDLVIVIKNIKGKYVDPDPKTYNDEKVKINFETIVNYCKENLDFKFNKIEYIDVPLEWNDILKCKTKKKDKAISKKFLPNKMNEKQFLEYELEDDEYPDDEEEEENNFQDDI